MQRTETKFLLSKSEIDYFFKQKNLYETYPKRKIFSVYFDTDNFKDFYDSEEGTVPRKKIRFRTYNFFDNTQKKQTEGQIEIKKTLTHNREKKVIDIRDKVENIFILIENFFKESRYPKIVVSYDRNYFTDINKDRFTVDKNIKYYKYSNSNFLNTPYVEERNILEFKSEKTLYNENTTFDFLDAYKVRFSKYCEGIKKVYSL